MAITQHPPYPFGLERDAQSDYSLLQRQFCMIQSTFIFFHPLILFISWCFFEVQELWNYFLKCILIQAFHIYHIRSLVQSSIFIFCLKMWKFFPALNMFYSSARLLTQESSSYVFNTIGELEVEALFRKGCIKNNQYLSLISKKNKYSKHLWSPNSVPDTILSTFCTLTRCIFTMFWCTGYCY